MNAPDTVRAQRSAVSNPRAGDARGHSGNQHQVRIARGFVHRAWVAKSVRNVWDAGLVLHIRQFGVDGR
jgi:hypothetical protein